MGRGERKNSEKEAVEEKKYFHARAGNRGEGAGDRAKKSK